MEYNTRNGWLAMVGEVVSPTSNYTSHSNDILTTPQSAKISKLATKLLPEKPVVSPTSNYTSHLNDIITTPQSAKISKLAIKLQPPDQPEIITTKRKRTQGVNYRVDVDLKVSDFRERLPKVDKDKIEKEYSMEMKKNKILNGDEEKKKKPTTKRELPTAGSIILISWVSIELKHGIELELIRNVTDDYVFFN